MIQFAKRGKGQLTICFILGIIAFPFAFCALLTIMIFRFTIGRFRK